MSVTRKKREITSNEDLTAIPTRIVPQSAEKTWTVPTLAMQLVTRYSIDSTLCSRSHSFKKKAKSDVAFPSKRKGMKKVVGEKEMPTIETMPAEHMKGNKPVESKNKAAVKLVILWTVM